MKRWAMGNVRLSTYVGSVAACAATLLSVTACSPVLGVFGHSSSPSPVILDAQATCSLVMNGSEPEPALGRLKGDSWLCRTTRYANAVTSPLPFDPLRSLPWGIAYAYNCGSRARDFRYGVANTGWDAAVSNSGRWLTGRQGRGYYMESRDTLAALFSISEVYRSDFQLFVLSGCTWHLRAVRGPASVVRAQVPAIPVLRRVGGHETVQKTA